MLQPLQIGTNLGDRYRVLQLVGQGGMSTVYKCADSRLEGRLCAIKEVWINPQLASARIEQTQEQFSREARTLATLDHPNLPKVSDFFSQDGRHYLVMDYVEGQDLLSLLQDAQRSGSRLSLSQVLSWADQLCSALAYLHEQDPPILHRDIKPANIKITAGNLLKLVDFGLVKWMAPDDNSTVTVIQGLGTVAYTPLEQYGDDTGHTDPRSDIYALGATLYHLLTGQQPASAKERFLEPGSLVPPTQLVPELPDYIDKAILTAMAMHPESRPTTIAQLQAMLHNRATLQYPQQSHSETWWLQLLRQDTMLVVLTTVLFLAALLLSIGF